MTYCFNVINSSFLLFVHKCNILCPKSSPSVMATGCWEGATASSEGDCCMLNRKYSSCAAVEWFDDPASLYWQKSSKSRTKGSLFSHDVLISHEPIRYKFWIPHHNFSPFQPKQFLSFYYLSGTTCDGTLVRHIIKPKISSLQDQEKKIPERTGDFVANFDLKSTD